jgi:hypothetical protein
MEDSNSEKLGKAELIGCEVKAQFAEWLKAFNWQFGVFWGLGTGGFGGIGFYLGGGGQRWIVGT